MRISMTLSTSSSTKISNQQAGLYKHKHQKMEFLLKFFYAWTLIKLKKVKFIILKHYKRNKTKFKVLVVAFVEGGMRTWIKEPELSSYKTLRGDRLPKYIRKFRFLFKVKIGKIYRNQNLRNRILYLLNKFENNRIKNKKKFSEGFLQV